MSITAQLPDPDAALEGAKAFGELAYVFVLLILIASGFGALWFWKIAIPRMDHQKTEAAERIRHNKANESLLGELKTVIESLKQAIESSTHRATVNEGYTRTLVSTKPYELRIHRKIAESLDVDVSDEVAGIKRAFETTENHLSAHTIDAIDSPPSIDVMRRGRRRGG